MLGVPCGVVGVLGVLALAADPAHADGRREDGRREDGRREDGRREDGRREDGRREDGRREDAPREASPRDHARNSTTVYLSSAWSPGPMVPIRVGADAVLRAHRSHVALEARIGAGGAATIIGLGGAFVGHVGVSLGAALPVRRSIVLTPMIAYDGFIEWEQHGATMAIHYTTFEIPLSIVLERGVVVEPFIQVGFARYQDVYDPVVVVGPRLGIVF